MTCVNTQTLNLICFILQTTDMALALAPAGFIFTIQGPHFQKFLGRS